MNRLKKMYSTIANESILILIILVFVIIMSFASPYFLKVSNLMNIIQYVSVYGITAIGMTMVILTGGINLSVGGTLALSAWVAARCMLDGMSWPLAMVLALAVGGVVGVVNGFAVAKIHIPPLIATLAMEQITRGLHMVLSVGKPLYGFEPGFLSFMAGKLFGIPKAVLWTIALFILFGFYLSNTRTGRSIYAVGGNPAATRIAGVNNTKVIVTVYTLAGALCAFAGLTLIARMDSIPVTIASGLDMSAITACVIGGASVTCGGKGRVFGTFLGILIMGLIQNSLDLLNVSPYYQKLIQGLVIFGAVMLDAIRNSRASRASAK